MKKLQATFNAVIVKPREEEETMYGGIIVPDLGKEKALIGTIVSIGEGYHSATGTWVDTSLKVGMEVMLPSMGPNKIEFDGQAIVRANPGRGAGFEQYLSETVWH
jgi:co-chaperonin GroES (HSP10)